jgi:hypothetical protein
MYRWLGVSRFEQIPFRPTPDNALKPITVSVFHSPTFRVQPEIVTTSIQSGAMMIREEFLLPDSADLESRSYSTAWRSVVGVDNFALDRKLRAAGLHLFCIAGELKVIELGWGRTAIGRGIKRVLTRGRKLDLNCMEIKQISSARFLGVPYVAIHARSFHIQKDAVLQSNAERKLEQYDRDWACGQERGASSRWGGLFSSGHTKAGDRKGGTKYAI